VYGLLSLAALTDSPFFGFSCRASVRFLCLSSFQTPLAVSSLFPVLTAPPLEAWLSFCIYTGLHASASGAT